MNYDDLIAHYRSQAKAASAIGVDRQRVYGWSKHKRVPLDCQILYEVRTEGRLLSDLDDDARRVLGRAVS